MNVLCHPKKFISGTLYDGMGYGTQIGETAEVVYRLMEAFERLTIGGFEAQQRGILKARGDREVDAFDIVSDRW